MKKPYQIIRMLQINLLQLAVFMQDSNFQGSQQEDCFDVQLHKRGQRIVKLNQDASNQLGRLKNNLQKKIDHNGNLDPQHQSRSNYILPQINNIHFDHFMMKNYSKNVKVDLLNEMRQVLENKGYKNIGKVIDCEPRQVMIARFRRREQNPNIFIIQDQTGKGTINVQNGVAWVGMIAAIQTTWRQNMYELQKIISLSTNLYQGIQPKLSDPLIASKTLVVKGPFRKNDKKQDVGGFLLSEVLKRLKKQKQQINNIIIMGPLLSTKNIFVQNCQLDKTFDDEFKSIIQWLYQQIKAVYPDIQVYFQPSVDDVTNYYPIPQPQYSNAVYKDKLHYISNPSTLNFKNTKNSFAMDIINYDILKYIDNNKGGRPLREVMLQNFMTYLKQPFYMTNTVDQPFDQVNLSNLYNQGNFGDIIIMSSNHSPPFARQVQGRVFINVGSLGLQPNHSGKHYMSVISIYDGQGPIANRCKVQSFSM